MKNSKGFTLIELMIIIAIIGILGAIAIPAFQDGGKVDDSWQCRGGYVFIQENVYESDYVQLVNGLGGGVTCDEYRESLNVFVEDSKTDW